MSVESARLRRLLAALLTLPLAITLGLVSAGGAQAATTVLRDSFRGTYLSGYLYSEDGCSYSQTYVSAAEDNVHYDKFSYNFCTGEFSAVYGDAAPTVFQVTGSLSTGHVIADIPLTHYDTGVSAGVMHLDNTWRSNGTATRSRVMWTDNLPGGYRTTYTSSGLRVDATATGTVPLHNAFMGSGSGSYMVVQHN